MAAGTPIQNVDQTGVVTASEIVSQAADQVPTLKWPRAIYVSVAGTVKGRLVGDSVDSTFPNVPVGIFPIALKNLLSTANGSTATITHFLY